MPGNQSIASWVTRVSPIHAMHVLRDHAAPKRRASRDHSADEFRADPDPNSSVDTPDLPARPLERPGYVCELALDRGAWIWRYRRLDRADAAYAQYRAQQGGGSTPL